MRREQPGSDKDNIAGAGFMSDRTQTEESVPFRL